MASRASSEVPAAGAPARIPALPGLGTTWYNRGVRYWLRRTLTAVLWLAVMALLCFLAISLYQGFTSEWSPTARTVSNWVQVIASCGTVVWGWLKQRQDHRKGLADPPSPSQFRGGKRRQTGRTPGLVALGRGLMLIATPVMPAVAAWCVGWSVAMLTVREYPSEVGARQALQRENGPRS